MTVAEVIAAGPGQPVSLTAWVKMAWEVKAAGKGTKQNLVVYDQSGKEIPVAWWDPTTQLQQGQQVFFSGTWGQPKSGVNIPQGAYTEVYDGKLRVVAKKSALAVVGATQPAAPASPPPPQPIAPPAAGQGQFPGQRRPDPAWGAGAGLPPAVPAPPPAAAPPPSRAKMTESQARAIWLENWRILEQTASHVPPDARAGLCTCILISIQRGDVQRDAPPQAAAQAAGGQDDDEIPF